MQQPIVLQLQALASEAATPTGELLRKAMLVATKLNLQNFRQWTALELNGYGESDQVPAYRVLNGSLRAINPINGLIPLMVSDADYLARLRRRPIKDSIDAIEHSISTNPEQPILYTFSPKTEAELMRQQTSVPLRPAIVFARNQFVGIVGAVRTKVLDWSLSLEQEGIVGDGLSFSEKERQLAHTQHIRIDNFQGILGNVSHGASVQQSNRIEILQGDFASLSRHLLESGLTALDLDELKTALDSDPAPATEKEGFGPRVSGWIGRMVMKAADGTWNVGIAAAGGMLAAALAKYYGLG